MDVSSLKIFFFKKKSQTGNDWCLQTYPSLTSLIRLMKASLFSLAFLLKFSPFNPSQRKFSRSEHKTEKTQWLSVMYFVCFFVCLAVKQSSPGGCGPIISHNSTLTLNSPLFVIINSVFEWNSSTAVCCWHAAGQEKKNFVLSLLPLSPKRPFLKTNPQWTSLKWTTNTKRQRRICTLPEIRLDNSSGTARIVTSRKCSPRRWTFLQGELDTRKQLRLRDAEVDLLIIYQWPRSSAAAAHTAKCLRVYTDVYCSLFSATDNGELML